MLNPRYAYDAKPLLELNHKQQAQKKRIESLIESGVYTYEEAPCLICNATHFETLATKDRYGLRSTTAICRECGLVQTTPRMNQSSYDHFYNDGHRNLYVGTATPTKKYLQQRIRAASITADYLSKHLLLSDLRVLEIGCGVGALLYVLKQRGAIVEGIDPSSAYLEAGKHIFNINAHTTDLFKIEAPQAYDLIIYSDVFEHLLQPAKHLQACTHLLSETGTLFIKLPGIKYMLRPYLNDFLRMLQQAHIGYYSADTLTNLLTAHGYAVLDINEQIYSLWKPRSCTEIPLMNCYAQIKEFLEKKEKQRWLRYILRQTFTLKHRLGRKT